MGKYTKIDNIEIDRKIDAYIEIIIEKIFKKIPQKEIKSIVLGGGFGKGEGGVIIENNNFRLLNDLDISIFPSVNLKAFKLKYQTIINELNDELGKIIPVRHIDIVIGNFKRFYIRCFSLAFSVNAYEYIAGHNVLYGKFPVRFLTSLYKPYKIPLIEGSKFFYTRGIGLLLAALLIKKNQTIHPDLNEVLFIELNKAKIAIGDAQLILFKKYHFSYFERLKRIENLFKEALIPENLYILYQEGISIKTNSQIEIKTKLELNNDFFKIKDIYINAFLAFESKRLNVSVNNICEYANEIAKKKRKLNEIYFNLDYFLPRLPLLMSLINDANNKDDNYINIPNNYSINCIFDNDLSHNANWLDTTTAFLKKYYSENLPFINEN